MTAGGRVLSGHPDIELFGSELDRLDSALRRRVNADRHNLEQGLAQLVLTLIELLRQLMERQALRRMEGGSLSADEVERLGETFMLLRERMEELKAEFERESRQKNGCVGSQLLSETDKVRIWIIRLAPGERIGFHRHVLNYFWTSVNGGRGRQHLMDGTTVEHSYFPGETRHETYGAGEYKVHDLENLGDQEMIFNTIEFLDSANKPLPVLDRVRLSRS